MYFDHLSNSHIKGIDYIQSDFIIVRPHIFALNCNLYAIIAKLKNTKTKKTPPYNAPCFNIQPAINRQQGCQILPLINTVRNLFYQCQFLQVKRRISVPFSCIYLVNQQKINVILGNLSNVLKFLKSIEFFFIFLDRWHKLVKLHIQTRLCFLNYASHKSPSVSYP